MENKAIDIDLPNNETKYYEEYESYARMKVIYFVLRKKGRF